MVEHIAQALLVQTLVLAAASAVVRLLQLATVRRLGAGAGYVAWTLVPVAMLAAALPHPAVDALAIHVDVAAAVRPWVSAPIAAPAHADVALSAAIAAWALGALLLAGLMARRQRRFEALVVPPAAGRAPCLPAGAGPAVLGLWRRRIVLPRDFDRAFGADERRLMLRHEGVHLRRADNAWNLLATALLVAHWFNPVAWWAWRRMRADQETSCDAAVLREESGDALATYAGALLKVQGIALAPPLATAWQSTHPLVERVRMLQHHRISPARHRLGLRIATLFVALAGLGGYSLQAGALPATAKGGGSVMTAIDVTDTTQAAAASGAGRSVVRSKFRVLTHLGEQAVVRLAEDSSQGPRDASLEIALTVSRLEGHRLQIDARLSGGAPPATLGTPRLVVNDGERADVHISSHDGAHDVAVSFLPRVVAQPESTPPALPAPPAPPTPGAMPALPAPPAAPTPAALPPLPAPPAPAALPPIPGVPPADDLPAPPAPAQRPA